MRAAVPAAVLAAGITLLFGASGDYMNCADSSGQPVFSVTVRAVTPKWKPIEGLQGSDFLLTENKIPRDICGFKSVRLPISVGILVDASGSMRDSNLQTRTGVEKVLGSAGPQDQYFLAYANDTAAIRVPFTSQLVRLRAGLAVIPWGQTALIDGLYLAFHEMRTAGYPTRALIVFSDGDDNASVYTVKDLETAGDISIPIFLVRAVSSQTRHESPEEANQRLELMQFIEKGGGRVVTVTNSEFLAAAEGLGSVIRQPYTLYYHSAVSAGRAPTVRVQVKGASPRPIIFSEKAAVAGQ